MREFALNPISNNKISTVLKFSGVPRNYFFVIIDDDIVCLVHVLLCSLSLVLPSQFISWTFLFFSTKST